VPGKNFNVLSNKLELCDLSVFARKISSFIDVF